MRIAVVGSGPAGLAAALAASENGAETAVFERMPELSVKLKASGGGRCNFSNTLPDLPFMEKFGRNGRFMQDALLAFPNSGIVSFLEDSGVPVSAADGFHWFPDSGRAADVAEAFRRKSVSLGTVFRTGSAVMDIRPGFRLILSGGETFSCDKVILACGGNAFPSLGGTGLGLELAKKLGHAVTEIYPALAPILIRDSWIGEHAGLSLRNAFLQFGKEKKKTSGHGELLFTHTGFSGPCALNVSGALAEAAADGKDVPLLFRPCCEHSPDFWKNEFEKMRREGKTMLVRNRIARLVPSALAERFCIMAGAENARCCDLKGDARDFLIRILGTGIVLSAPGTASFEKAMTMRGGVALKEVNPKTMESRIVPGVYFAGEILDLSGPCGGYHIRWALSSGFLAGMSAAGTIQPRTI